MVAPAASRLPLVNDDLATVLVFVLLLAACLVHDYYERGRMHPLNLWGSIAILASVPGRVALAQTAAWHSVAEWMALGLITRALRLLPARPFDEL